MSNESDRFSNEAELVSDEVLNECDEMPEREEIVSTDETPLREELPSSDQTPLSEELPLKEDTYTKTSDEMVNGTQTVLQGEAPSSEKVSEEKNSAKTPTMPTCEDGSSVEGDKEEEEEEEEEEEYEFKQPVSRVLVIADEHGRYAREEFHTNLLLMNCDLLVIRKPQSSIEGLMHHVEQLTHDFNKFDYVIMCGGIWNVWGPYYFAITRFRQLLFHLRRCNVIMVEMPYRLWYPDVNVRMFNHQLTIRDICVEFGALYLETNGRVHTIINEQLILLDTDEFAVFPRIMDLIRGYMFYLNPNLNFHLNPLLYPQPFEGRPPFELPNLFMPPDVTVAPGVDPYPSPELLMQATNAACQTDPFSRSAAVQVEFPYIQLAEFSPVEMPNEYPQFFGPAGQNYTVITPRVRPVYPRPNDIPTYASIIRTNTTPAAAPQPRAAEANPVTIQPIPSPVFNTKPASQTRKTSSRRARKAAAKAASKAKPPKAPPKTAPAAVPAAAAVASESQETSPTNKPSVPEIAPSSTKTDSSPKPPEKGASYAAVAGYGACSSCPTVLRASSTRATGISTGPYSRPAATAAGSSRTHSSRHHSRRHHNSAPPITLQNFLPFTRPSIVPLHRRRHAQELERELGQNQDLPSATAPAPAPVPAVVEAAEPAPNNVDNLEPLIECNDSGNESPPMAYAGSFIDESYYDSLYDYDEN